MTDEVLAKELYEAWLGWPLPPNCVLAPDILRDWLKVAKAARKLLELERIELGDLNPCDRATLARLRSQVEALRGAMNADDRRLREAAARVGKDHHGCDSADWMADLILFLRAKVARLEAIVDRLPQGERTGR